MKRKPFVYAVLFLLIAATLSACQQGVQQVDESKKTVVVTYSILGSVVKELAGDSANIVVLMPNGSDPHEWEPSAKDIETLNKADLIVHRGRAYHNSKDRTGRRDSGRSGPGGGCR